MAEMGNHVVCVDIDEDKIKRLNAGDIPIYEPGLEPLIQSNREAGRLEFTVDVEHGVNHGLFQFVAVGTPPDEDGSADLQHVLAVARSIGEHMDGYRIIVDKSTVPVGTGSEVARLMRAARPDADFDVASNPEFLREGSAINDFMRPDRVVIGVGTGLGTIENDDTATLSINDVSQVETDSGTNNFVFTISSDLTASKDLTVVVNTADLAEAVAGTDYTAITNQTATITAGNTSTSPVSSSAFQLISQESAFRRVRRNLVYRLTVVSAVSVRLSVFVSGFVFSV